VDSIHVIKNVLVEFEGLSGLRANPDKSLAFYAGISGRDKETL
jgi:hypothetical protein